MIQLGGAKAEVYHFGNGHTGGNSIVYFPDLKVLCGGDAIVGVQPNFDYPDGGSLLGEQKELAKAAKLKFDTVVPGHSGPNSVTLTRADFDTYKMKIDTLVTRFEGEIKAGTPKDQILARELIVSKRRSVRKGTLSSKGFGLKKEYRSQES